MEASGATVGMSMTLRITVPSRIHITLIDLASTGYRRNGGIGFSLADPAAVFEFEPSPVVDLSLLKTKGFKVNEIKRLHEVVSTTIATPGQNLGIHLTAVNISNRHIGLGVGTASALACVEASCILNGKTVEQSKLVQMSGRAGTSGVGCHCYFLGGFVFDVGRKYDTDPIMSSDDINGHKNLPVTLYQSAMPDWSIGLFRPVPFKPVSQESERALFSNKLPLNIEDVFKTTYHVVFGAVAAIADKDFDSFCLAVNEIQNCAWKRHEIELHGDVVLPYFKRLKELGCDAVGMSSVGPTLFFLSKDFSATVERIKVNFPDAVVATSLPSNSGRTISYV
jgi:beta-ribofuranosylaminobenzene 5'-phosphate synthase